MDLTKTLVELREKRDYYIAAVTALEKIQAYDAAKVAAPMPMKRTKRGYAWTDEQKARASERQRERWAKVRANKPNGADHGEPIVVAQ